MAIVPLPDPNDKEGVKQHIKYLKTITYLSAALWISLGVAILLIACSII